MRSQECVIHTDTSGRFSVDSVENYKIMSETHVAEGAVISEEGYNNWLTLMRCFGPGFCRQGVRLNQQLE